MNENFHWGEGTCNSVLFTRVLVTYIATIYSPNPCCDPSHSHQWKCEYYVEMALHHPPPRTGIVRFPSQHAGRSVREESMWERMKKTESKGRENERMWQGREQEWKERMKMSADSKWVGASCEGARLWDVKERKGKKQLEYKKTLKWESVHREAQLEKNVYGM